VKVKMVLGMSSVANFVTNKPHTRYMRKYGVTFISVE
jgi:hypothetical protein